MAGITGQGDTFDLPNFVGELFQITPADTPFLSMIGGLTGGRPADATLFQWQSFDLRAGAADRQRLEGANAPTAEARVRANITNVVQIHQEAIEISYTKQAATGQYRSTGSSHAGSVGISGSNPVLDEMSWQVTQAIKSIALDVEVSFLTSTFSNPSTNATARRTRGLDEAIATNVVDAAGATLTEDMVLDLMQTIWAAGGIMEQETATLMCNGYQKRQLTDIFITQKNYAEESRNVAGVRVTTIETDFGRLNVMLNRHMPVDKIFVVSAEECAPRFLPIPGKGFLFQEALAKVGAAERTQIYGEIGLEYGLETHHGKVENLADGTGS
jgi:hypothetical protein